MGKKKLFASARAAAGEGQCSRRECDHIDRSLHRTAIHSDKNCRKLSEGKMDGRSTDSTRPGLPSRRHGIQLQSDPGD